MSARMTPQRIRWRERELSRAARAVGWRPCPESTDGYHRYAREPGGVVCCFACGEVPPSWQAERAPDLYPKSRETGRTKGNEPTP